MPPHDVRKASPAAFTETPLVFAAEGERLVGVLAQPGTEAPRQRTGVVIVVGGPQVRFGSHRHFLQLARHLASQGHPTLRFDVRGMGDSSGEPRHFEQLDADIAAAIGALQQAEPGLQRVVLWGLCDGASAALLYLQRQADPRVGGLVLLNPWVRSPQSLARATLKHYYWQRLLQPGFWRKLASGSIGRRALADWWQNWRAARQGSPAVEAPFAVRMAQAWRGFPGPILLLLSGADVTAHEFADHAGSDPAWAGALQRAGLTRIDLPGADHTFSEREAGERVLVLTREWLQGPGA